MPGVLAAGAQGIIPAYAGSTKILKLRVHRLRDHPRIRGEHGHASGGGRVDGGSSPHTRGAPDVVSVPALGGGIIPAYAGSTRQQEQTNPTSQDHPRIRGEHLLPALAGLPVVGSSPHTRGARRFRPCGGCGRGIIPAYAGSTLPARGRPDSCADHPRIRGEHDLVAGVDLLADGSSPHTRGALPARSGDGPPSRIIPAYAGSTKSPAGVVNSAQDHPRIRGEHLWILSSQRTRRGSSPHTRGARRLPGAGRCGPRIIPAYAGSTDRRRRPGGSMTDHPRIRGEHSFENEPSAMARGSSPHTRGARELLRRDAFGGGIIPAYAGSTLFSREAIHQTRDHPRIRGEHATGSRSPPRAAGSSPHTRGALHAGHRQARDRRIIPAYAGSTHFYPFNGY